jgi:hypothetical protein
VRRIWLDEELRMDHTDNLTGRYRYNFFFTNLQGQQSIQHSGSLNLQHWLYDSLTSSHGVEAIFTDFEGGESVRYGALSNLVYKKTIPLGGLIQLGLNGSYRLDDQDTPGGELSIFQEKHTVRGFELIFLNNPQILPRTAVVTDPTGTLIFQEGFDYRLVQIGDLTAVERIPTGELRDDEPILVSYRFLSPPVLRFTTLETILDARLRFEWVELYYGRTKRDQRLLRGSPLFLDELDAETFGIRLKWTSRRLRAEARSEYRDHQGSRVAFTAPTFTQTVTFIPVRGLTIRAGGGESFFSFTLPRRKTTTYRGRLSLFWRPRRSLESELFGDYLRILDTLSPDETFYEAGIRIRARLGRLVITPAFTYSLRRVGGGESRTMRGSIWVTRYFL